MKCRCRAVSHQRIGCDNYSDTRGLKQRAHGSVFDTITQETFTGVTLIYPKSEVIGAFDVCVEPLMLRIRENLLQSQTLATLRDTLLPRLISGQLRLPDADIEPQPVELPA